MRVKIRLNRKIYILLIPKIIRMEKEITKLTDEELQKEINSAISTWQFSFTKTQFEEEIVKELREEQVKRLIKTWHKQI